MISPKKCALCNNSTFYLITFTKDFEIPGKRVYFHCHECDLIFVPQQFHLSSADEEKRYLLHNNTLSNEGYVNMFLEKIKLIKHYCPDINSVLDYGCGNEPVLIELLRREAYDCDGYDLYFHPGFPVRSYDLVISTEAFEHFRDIRNELTKICSLLKQGGFLAIMTLLHGPVEDFENWWYHSDPTHICFFSMKTFDWISEQFGFKIIYSNQKNFIILKLK